jgi:Transcriptional Coactivator p15 (PC4)
MAQRVSARQATKDEVIGAVSRMKREEIRVSVRRSAGMKWLDLRIYYEDETGAMRPSQRGVSISPKDWVKLREILGKLQKEGRSEGGASDRPRD